MMYIVAFFFMAWINYNGTFEQHDLPLLRVQNRSFRYGDGLFETIRVIRKKVPLKALHFDRLLKSLVKLHYEIPAYLDHNWFTQILDAIIEKNNLHHGSIRFSVWSGEKELFQPARSFNYLVEARDLNPVFFNFNETGLQVNTFSEGRKAPDNFANLKSASYLLYTMAAHYAMENNLDDVLILNTNEKVIETSIANIFIIRDGNIFTPPLSDGCVSGVYRRFLIDSLVNEYNITEQSLTVDDVMGANEIFLTNALRGIRWVAGFRNGQYGKKLTRQIASYLETLPG